MADSTRDDLLRSCQSIADTLSRYLNGEYYCDDCGIWFKGDECPECKMNRDDCDDLYEYISDALDIKIVVDLRDYVYGCRITMGWGGPNIYIDTEKEEVQGYWGTDEIHIPLSSEMCNRIDELISDMRC